MFFDTYIAVIFHVSIRSSFFDVSDNIVVVWRGRDIFLENSPEGILDACVMTWSVEEDTFAGGL